MPYVFFSAHLKALYCIARRYLTFHDKRPQQRKIGTKRTAFLFSKNSLNGHKIRGNERDRKKGVIVLGRHFSAISAVALLVDNNEVKLIFRHSKKQI